MSNTNTDQRIVAGQVAAMKNPTAATITYFQFAPQPSQATQTGNAQIPIPGQYKAIGKKVLVRAYGNSKLASVNSQALTVTLNVVNNAATPVTTVIATTGAVTATTMASKTVGWYIEAEILLDPATATVMAGKFSGVSVAAGGTTALIAAAVLSAQPALTQSNITGVGAIEGYDEAQYFQVAITQAQTDTAAVHTLLELSADVI